MKEFNFNINLKIWHGGIEAETREEAIEKVKKIFKEEYNIDLKNEEIVDDTYREFGGQWCLEDIRHQAESRGIILTPKELNEVADLCEYEFDACIGINWDVIDYHTDTVVDDR